MEKQNVVLIDNTPEEMEPFLRGLEAQTHQRWTVGACRANGGRKSVFSNLGRYGKYFTYSFRVFRKRKEYGCILAWQSFYGLIFAFWCRLFGVRKENPLVILHLTYRPKKGAVGKLYAWFWRYILKSEYIDGLCCCAREHGRYCGAALKVPETRFACLPFGVADLQKRMGPGKKGDYILSIGRSNRDWDFLIRALEDCGYPVRIVCDTLEKKNLPENITVYRQVWGETSYEWIRDCAMVVIPVLDRKIASGETVLLQAMCFGKPVVAARSDGGWEDYLKNEETGLVVPKEKEALLTAVGRLMTDERLYDRISENSRREYLRRFTLEDYGRRTGELVKEYLG